MKLKFAWRIIWRNPKRTGIILTAIIIGISAVTTLTSLPHGMEKRAIHNMVLYTPWWWP